MAHPAPLAPPMIRVDLRPAAVPPSAFRFTSLDARDGGLARGRGVTALGSLLFEQAALDAVRQWRYQPLLLNGIPYEFVLSVTMNFHLSRP